MDRLLHPDPDVAARLRSWGVAPDSEEAEAARRLFPTFEAMADYIRVGYLKVKSNSCRDFFASFLMDSSNGFVEDKRRMYLSGKEGLRLADELGAQRQEVALFAHFVQAWNVNARDGIEFDSDPQSGLGVLVEAWTVVFQVLGLDTALKMRTRGYNLFAAHVIEGLKTLLADGLTKRDLDTYELSFRSGDFRDDQERGYFTVPEVRQMHAAGVPSDYAVSLARHGFDSLVAPDAIAFWTAGVPVEYAAIGLGAGFSVEKVAQMHRDGIAVEYMTSMGEGR